MAVNDKYLDPRLKIEQMIYDIRGMLLDIEHTLGNIPHEAEAAEASRATIRAADATLQVSMDSATTADELKALMPAQE